MGPPDRYGSSVTRRWRKTDSNSRSHRERNSCGSALWEIIGLSTYGGEARTGPTVRIRFPANSLQIIGSPQRNTTAAAQGPGAAYGAALCPPTMQRESTAQRRAQAHIQSDGPQPASRLQLP